MNIVQRRNEALHFAKNSDLRKAYLGGIILAHGAALGGIGQTVVTYCSIPYMEKTIATVEQAVAPVVGASHPLTEGVAVFGPGFLGTALYVALRTMLVPKFQAFVAKNLAQANALQEHLSENVVRKLQKGGQLAFLRLRNNNEL
jgi:hypothetical protein